MKIYLELDYEESVLVLWALKDLYQFNAEIANDEYLQRLQGLIKKQEILLINYMSLRRDDYVNVLL